MGYNAIARSIEVAACRTGSLERATRRFLITAQLGSGHPSSSLLEWCLEHGE